MLRLAKVLTALLFALLLGAPGTSRAVLIDFVFSDPPGVGFNDPVLGPARVSALRFAGDRFGGFFEGFSGQRRSVDVSFRPLVLPSERLFAEARTVNAVVRNDDAAVPRIAIALPLFEFIRGRHFSTAPLPEIHFNPGTVFTIGLPPGARSGNTPDLVTVAMHELGHIFGFSSNLDPDGTYGPAPTVFDTGIADVNGNLLVSLTPEERLAAAASSSGDRAFWVGIEGVAANGGIPPNLSAAAPFTPGTNLWHLSDTFFSPEVLMDASIETVIHDLHPVERAIYQDLGWKLTPLQEPVQVTEAGLLPLFLLGLVALSFLIRAGRISQIGHFQSFAAHLKDKQKRFMCGFVLRMRARVNLGAHQCNCEQISPCV